MNIQNNLRYAYHVTRNFLNDIKNSTFQKIQNICNRIWQAYQEPSKDVQKLIIAPHPTPNPYNKEHKKKSWPSYLDNAQGCWYASPDDVQDIARNVEPLEKVTPLHANALGNNDRWAYRIINGIPFFFDALGNNERGTYRLIADGGDLNAKDIRGQTPSYWAAYRGNLDTLTRLVIFGADFMSKDYRGKTPLRAAVKYGHEKVVAFLASHKVNLNELDGRGLTPLHLAAYRGHFSVYEKLIYFGADRSIKDCLGRTAEELLKIKYAELYHNRWFIGRLFSSPIPPPLSLGPWKIEQLTKSSACCNSND